MRKDSEDAAAAAGELQSVVVHKVRSEMEVKVDANVAKTGHDVRRTDE